MKKRLFSLLLCLTLLLSSCTPSPRETASLSPAGTPTSVPTETPEPTPTPTPEPQDTHITLSFGGDVLVHDSVFNSASNGDGTYDFLSFLQYGMEDFFHADWNLVNMENPIDVYGSNEKVSSYPRFNAPREIIDFTKTLGVDTVTFCNNHVYDKGYSGFCTTLDNLEEGGLSVTGGYRSSEEFNTPFLRDVNGIRIGVISYTNLVNSHYGLYQGEMINTLEPDSVRLFVQSASSAPEMNGEIQKLRDAGADLVLVYLHWGSEYQNEPKKAQKDLAHALCEGGADIILGGHSHCVQPMEKFTCEDGRESLIFYSLGNLFADQVGLSKSKYGSDIGKTQYGVKVNVAVKKDVRTGKVSIEGGDYEPTCLLRRKKETKNDYYYLASGRYALSETADPLFPDDAAFKECIAGYEHVTKILGNDVLPVHKYE